MTHALIPTASWTLPVMAPSIGETVAASTVSAGEQPLTNQLAYLSQSMFTKTGTLDLKGALTVEKGANIEYDQTAQLLVQSGTLSLVTTPDANTTVGLACDSSDAFLEFHNVSTHKLSQVDCSSDTTIVSWENTSTTDTAELNLNGSFAWFYFAPGGVTAAKVALTSTGTAITGNAASITTTGANVISGTLTTLQGTTKMQGIFDQGYVAVDITGTASSLVLTEAQFRCGTIAFTGNYTGAGINILVPCAGHSWIKVFDGTAATLGGATLSIAPVGFPGGGLTGKTLNNHVGVYYSDGTNPQGGTLN